MAEKVAKLGIKREPGYLYFLRGSDVYKAPMRRGGKTAGAGKGRSEKVSNGHFNREEGYLYFLDAAGDVSRAKRAVGGQKRKKTAAPKKAAPKKAAPKKVAAKKAAPKKAAPKKVVAKKAVAKPAAKPAAKATKSPKKK